MTLNEEQIDRLYKEVPDVMDFFMLVLDANIKQASNIYEAIRENLQLEIERSAMLDQEVQELRREVGRLMAEVSVLRMQHPAPETTPQ